VTKLAAAVHNPYFIDEVVHFLNQICPGCLNPKENVNIKVCALLIDLISPLLSMTDRLYMQKDMVVIILSPNHFQIIRAFVRSSLLIDLMT
jgi:hypothetical protein